MTMPTATLPPKRKANDELRKPVDKLQRPNTTTASRPITQAQRPTAVDTSMGRMKIDTNQRRPTPNSANTTNTTFKNGQPTPPPSSTESAKPPKKGSYAEIMARGKAAQATLGQPGQTLGRNVQSGTNGTKSVGAKAQPPVVEKKVKKAATATTGYTGTARPRPGGSATATKPATPSYSSRSGAAFEVDDEEEKAAMIARREDAEALAEENRLKKEKAEKRARLAAMAKSRR
ncbi:hypothetical protein DID88_002743 [Monilinia fructigena]|uniref:SPT2 chromatin protein n=1 Tax=Monilinia fructigena TaxID=38457 RepID=A0A395IMZ5_9HELO|nr:hypothetical protein DID88_002743 [Monilinia fructigena]